MPDASKKFRLGLPIAASLVAAAAVGGPALASAKHHGRSAQSGNARPQRGPQGPQGPAGPGASSGAGTSGTAAGGGGEGTILYAANAGSGTTLIYSGHGLTLTAACNSNGPVLTLKAAPGNIMDVNDNLSSPTPADASLGNYSNNLITSPGQFNDILYGSNDGAVVQMRFATSIEQPGSSCYMFGTRLGG